MTSPADPRRAGQPAGLRTPFDTLVAALPADVRIDALKTAIVLAAHATFCYVVVQHDRLLVGVFLDRALDSPRVTKVDRVSPARSQAWSRCASPAT
jgi:hypothetical protein